MLTAPSGASEELAKRFTRQGNNLEDPWCVSPALFCEQGHYYLLPQIEKGRGNGYLETLVDVLARHMLGHSGFRDLAAYPMFVGGIISWARTDKNHLAIDVPMKSVPTTPHNRTSVEQAMDSPILGSLTAWLVIQETDLTDCQDALVVILDVVVLAASVGIWQGWMRYVLPLFNGEEK